MDNFRNIFRLIYGHKRLKKTSDRFFIRPINIYASGSFCGIPISWKAYKIYLLFLPITIFLKKRPIYLFINHLKGVPIKLLILRIFLPHPRMEKKSSFRENALKVANSKGDRYKIARKNKLPIDEKVFPPIIQL